MGILPRKLPLRSLSEIRFRLRQELTNVRLLAFPSHLPAAVPGGNFHALPVMGGAMYVPEIRCNGQEVRIIVEEGAN